MTGVQWQPVNQAGHLYERVVNQITRLIEERSLQPGDRVQIVERAMRAHIRGDHAAAMRRLWDEGIQ